MAFADALFEVTKQLTLAGTTCDVTFTVERTYRTDINFALLGKTYTFSVTKWGSGGLNNFLKLFHSYCPRDAAQFGTLTVDDEGAVTVKCSVEQKVAAVVKASTDVMACVDKILFTHRRGVLDYAFWYRENHKELDTYADYITLVASHCIVHCEFLAPSVTWTLVKFSEAAPVPVPVPAAGTGGAAAMPGQ